MDFWRVEVKPGETVKCKVEEGTVLHLSQAALGAFANKGSEVVPISLEMDHKKSVLGTLHQKLCAQIHYDLVFEKKFRLSHTSKNVSVFFHGYRTSLRDELSDNDYGKDKGKNEVGKRGVVKANASKKDNSAAKAKGKEGGESVKAYKPKASDNEEEDDEDESDDKAAASGQKRPAGSAAKTTVPKKKAKIISPAEGQKTGGDKKGGHSVSCKACSKSFNSEDALQAHSKRRHSGSSAKHSGGK